MKLTKKKQAFADGLLNQPKASATEIANQVFNTKNRNVAKSMASEYLAKPDIQAYLATHDTTAQTTIVEVMQNSSNLKDEPAHARVALDSAKDILNRLHGLPVARTETRNTSVSINLDLTSVDITQQG